VNRALYAAATGMAAQQRMLDVIANDLANADVAGFKASSVRFASLGGDARLGTVERGVVPIFSQGKLEKSGGPFDLAIEGSGFFAVERDGRQAYSRAGAFERAADGSVRNADGWRLRGVRIPADATAIRVAADGRISIDALHKSNIDAGRVRLVAFDAPESLRSIGSSLFAATSESGAARLVRVGREGEPKIAFGMLEKSNVSIIEAMMQILAAQRAYEANAKGVQAADEMLRIADNLHH
jgi:flagellar basal-body rod protein FlgG